MGLVRDSALPGPSAVVCFCWPAELWFLHERAKQGGATDLCCSVHALFFLRSALYHFMFCILYEQLRCGKGSGWPRHFLLKWGPLCYTDPDKMSLEEVRGEGELTYATFLFHLFV